MEAFPWFILQSWMSMNVAIIVLMGYGIIWAGRNLLYIMYSKIILSKFNLPPGEASLF